VTALRKLLAAGFVLGFGVVVSVLADDKKDLEAMQGVWIFTDHETDGKTTPNFKAGVVTVTLKGDTFAVREGDKILQAGTMKLGAEKGLKTIDCPVTEGAHKGITMLGIYTLDGDNMKVCFDTTGKDRPQEFKTDKDRFLVTCKRDKK
jgi:uncharacterized protein (TIGR03067 family)